MALEWIHGRNAVFEVLRAARREIRQVQVAQGIKQTGRIPDILSICQARDYAVSWVPRSSLDKRGFGHQGVAVQTGGYPYADFADILEKIGQVDQRPLVLILDMIQDPQNLGTLLRTAEAVGVIGVLLPLRRAAQVTAAVVQASSGATEHMAIAQANLARAMVELKQAGLWIIGLAEDPDSTPLGKVRLDGPVGVVVGNEGQGMRRLVRESCDILLRIPMRGKIESLNAAVAGSIALYFAWEGDGFQGE
jgi:23S rRNA (guanosine2251-2'-O)-methyltransferase